MNTCSVPPWRALRLVLLALMAFGCTSSGSDPLDGGPADGALDGSPPPDLGPDRDAGPIDQGPCTPSEEVCDGLDNDCDGAIDEADGGGALTEDCYDGPDGTAGIGVCVMGLRTCTDGAFGACEGQVQPSAERCDDQDHDCDGAADDVDVGGDCTRGLGACEAAGRAFCDPETGEVRCDATPGAPVDEACDGVDNDCDGSTDEAVAEPCYDGPAGTEGVGACSAGQRRCIAGAFGRCEGQVLPGIELCDDADHDCDGEVGDIDGLGAACSDGVGACNAPGTVICDTMAGQVRCDAELGAPVPEICDGIDNDCDGEVDDVAGVGEACSAGVGACAAEGTQVCDARARTVVCDAVPGEPGEEQCNGIDDDCNGIVDDAPGAGAGCQIGLGLCAVGGRMACDGAELACDPAAVAEWCRNGQDDDADGETDEVGCLYPCTEAADCALDAACVQGACAFNACANDADCGARGLCEAGTCTVGQCRETADCPDGDVCLDRLCWPGDCTGDDQCADGQICDQQRCVPVPASCANPPAIRSFGTLEGSTVDAPDDLTGSCGASIGSERVFQLRLDYAGTVCVDTFGSSFDTVLHARSACERSESQRACNDDWGSGVQQLQSRLQLEVEQDTPLFVVVDGYNRQTGDFRLAVRPGPCGTLCEDDDACRAVESCRQPPAYLPQVPIAVDGRANCGRDVCGQGAIIEGLAPWPAYAAFYVDGSAIYDVNDGRRNAGISIAVDGYTRSTAPRILGLVDDAAVRAAYAGLATAPFAVGADAQVEAFFLDNFCGDNAGVVQAEVRPVAVCTDLCDFDDDCREGLVCNGRRCRSARDWDADGVRDHLDLDDDNDGIPDAIECFGPGTMAVNGSFELPAPPDPEANIFGPRDGDVPGWSTLPAGRALEFWRSGFNGVPAPHGEWFIELNANGRDTLYQDLRTAPGMRYDISFQHRGRQGVEAMALRIGAPDETVEVLRAETGQEWVTYRARYIVPADQPVTRFELASLVDGSLGNLLDAVQIVPRCDEDASQDADHDGRPNNLDLDADGDGVLDRDEAGHGQDEAALDAAPGANGLADVVEIVPDSGDIDYVLSDTDGDGVPDFLQP